MAKRIRNRTEYKKKYREENKEKIAAYGKKWREANKEKIAEQNKKRWESIKKTKTTAPKISKAERLRQYQKNNKEKIAEKQRNYRKANLEKHKEYERKAGIKKYLKSRGITNPSPELIEAKQLILKIKQEIKTCKSIM